MTALKMLILNIFLFSDEDDRCLLDPVGVGHSVVLSEVGSLMEIVEDALN